MGNVETAGVARFTSCRLLAHGGSDLISTLSSSSWAVYFPSASWYHASTNHRFIRWYLLQQASQRWAVTAQQIMNEEMLMTSILYRFPPLWLNWCFLLVFQAVMHLQYVNCTSSRVLAQCSHCCSHSPSFSSLYLQDKIKQIPIETWGLTSVCRNWKTIDELLFSISWKSFKSGRLLRGLI